ncbi:MAG: hypothetical protein A2W91_04130 [Bacteroidetes bacterium GWF2_38_335]|nr:MAG: hypothetical protein A2W91_04130 [Bacteroidetes bacterium GWF2_38_335]OFY79139.1 MAG: hypothetical protein A2281_03465 [Bacteroidetes bacterium RIFOXYA12_FULL_38_20]HBS88774.1 hypothetical protein [Bacteroidales bacterium]
METTVTRIRLIITAVLITASLFLNAQTPVRKVLLEEFTTASCGNCPMASYYINNWQVENAEHCIMIAIHEGSGNDAMSSATTDAIFSAMHPDDGWFAPAIMIDRGVYPWVDPEAYLSCYSSFGSDATPGIDTIATRLINEPAKVGIEISGTYNPVTRTINADVTATFVESLPSGDWRINMFLVEDSVVGYPGLGCFEGWDQHCYDHTFADTHYPGMFDGESIIGYPHRHVMRDALLGNWGASGIIPSVPVIETDYVATAEMVVDTAYKENHLSLVAFVSSYGPNKTDKFIINANDIKLSELISTNIAEEKSNLINVYPNPAINQVNIEFPLKKAESVTISILNMMGETVKTICEENPATGMYFKALDISELERGVYFISIESNKIKEIKKIIVQ